jgi:hypothetical protein
VLETEKRRKEKKRIASDLAVCSRSAAQSGTSGCPVVHQIVSSALGWTPVKRPLLGNVLRHTAKIHRTVRWCTGLSGEPTVASATVGRATVDRAIHRRRVARANGRQGAPDYLVCTGQCPVRQLPRGCNGRLR